MSKLDEGYQLALANARSSYLKDGGIPIGACLVNREGTVLGQGHNMRIQKKSPTLHVRLDLTTLSRRIASKKMD